MLTRVWLSVTSWTAACQVSLSITSSQSLFKLMFIESVMPSNHLILCRPLLLPPSIFPSKEAQSFHWVSLSNSRELWAMLCRATQDGWVVMESSDKMVVHWRREWVKAKNAAKCPSMHTLSSPPYKKRSSCVEVEKTSFRAFYKVCNVAFCCDSVKKLSNFHFDYFFNHL